MNVYLLEAKYTSKKSFYNKAMVIVKDNGEKVLKSYRTEVASIDKDGKVAVNGYYSPTTTRHIKEFLLQNGFNDNEIKKLLKEAKDNE